jgi:eukaryotic-like serine/threonine-protein kinase
MKAVSHSLKILHDLHIVHGDLKPSNILIKRTELGYTSKLIDFDSSYIAGSPPPAEEIVGTINYYSPELLGYIQEAGVPASELGVASDLFALGLIFTEFLTGAPPPFDVSAYHEPAVAVRHGETLRVPRPGIDPQIADLIDAMLLADPARRPTIADVHQGLMAVRPPDADRRAGRSTTSFLRGKGVGVGLRSGDTRATARGVGVPAPASRLIGKLVNGRPKKDGL